MRKQTLPLIYILAGLKFVLPFLLQHQAYELHRDEYLYYAQGQHLDFGFLENPPLIGLLGAISSLFGATPFWIKFWPALFGAATLLVTASLAKELGGRLYAQVLASLGLLFSAYLRIHFLFQPNFLDIFFWTLSAYYIVRYSNTQQPRYVYLLAIALALGWWSKYSVLFFIAAFFIALLLSPQRMVFTRKHFWQAAALGLLLILPNLLWQYVHNWPLAHHMAELRDTQLQYVNRSDFIKEQVLMLFPVFFLWLGGLVWLLRKRAYRIIGFTYLGIIALLMLGSGKGYYALGAYPMLIAGGGVWIEGMSISKSWIRYTAVALVLVLAVPSVPLLIPMQAPPQMAESNKKYGIEKLGLLRWEDRKNHLLQQDFADMQGWKELTSKAEAVFDSVSTFSKAHTVVYCRNYGQAGALRYYARTAAFRNNVISDNGTFLFWIPKPLVFENLVFIGPNMPGKDDVVFQHFEKVAIIDSVANPYSRQYGDKIILFQQADAVASQLANEGLKKKRAQFQR
jgi:hypothetical protein